MRRSSAVLSLEEALLDRLRTEPRLPADSIMRESITRDPGLYVWYEKDSRRPSYVGKATGRRGLRGRIWSQHLNPNYLEVRPEKQTQEDRRQLRHGVRHNQRPAIEKSAFRKALARRFDLAPGQPVVEFIRERYELALLPLPHETHRAILTIEYSLIATLSPLLNRSGNSKSEAKNAV